MSKTFFPGYSSLYGIDLASRDLGANSSVGIIVSMEFEKVMFPKNFFLEQLKRFDKTIFYNNSTNNVSLFLQNKKNHSFFKGWYFPEVEFAFYYLFGRSCENYYLHVKWSGTDKWDIVEDHLYHPIFGYLARNTGKICLHGNVVQIEGQVFSVLGHSTAGKSTTTLGLCRNGASLIADDVCALSLVDDNIHVWKGLQNLKITKSVLDHFSIESSSFRIVYSSCLNYFNKSDHKLYCDQFRCLLDNNRTSFELNKLFILRGRNSKLITPKIKRLRPKEALVELCQYSHVRELMNNQDRKKEFGFIANLAKKIPTYTLEMPDSLDLLDSSCQKILDTVTEI